MTVSPALMCNLLGPLAPISAPPYLKDSQHFRRQGNDLHEVPFPEFPGDRSENPRSARTLVFTDHHGGILVKPDVGAVAPPARSGGTNHDRLHDIPFLDNATGCRLFHGSNDDVSDPCGILFRSAQYPNAHQLFRAGVVGYAQAALRLNHRLPSFLTYRCSDDDGFFQNLYEAPALFFGKG